MNTDYTEPDYATHADYEAVLWDERLAYLFVGVHVPVVEELVVNCATTGDA